MHGGLTDFGAAVIRCCNSLGIVVDVAARHVRPREARGFDDDQAAGPVAHRARLRNCVIGMRAEPWPYEATEYLALESHLMERARGMAMDAPAVRP